MVQHGSADPVPLTDIARCSGEHHQPERPRGAQRDQCLGCPQRDGGVVGVEQELHQSRLGGCVVLLAHVVDEQGVVRVDVNEQNPDALGFYLSRGFHHVGRSDLDGDGRPYPILHLALPRDP